MAKEEQIEMDGTVSPLQFGFSRRYSLGNLHRDRLSDMAPRWAAERLAAFRRVCRVAHARASTAGGEIPLTNWYDAVRRAAEAA